MRLYLFPFVLALSTSGFANDSLVAGSDLKKLMAESGELEEKVPPEFAEQKIVVLSKDGKSQGSFDRSKFKIVPRVPNPKPKAVVAAPVVCPVIPPSSPTKVIERIVKTETKIFAHNRFRLLAGVGYDGLEVESDKNKDLTVQQKQDFIGSAAYDYSWSYDWSGSLQYISNKGFLVGGGYSW